MAFNNVNANTINATTVTTTNLTTTNATITNINGGQFGINQIMPVTAIDFFVQDPVTGTFVNSDAIDGTAFAAGTENRIYTGGSVPLKVGTYRVSYSLKQGPSMGITQVQINGIDFGSAIDCYNAAETILYQCANYTSVIAETKNISVQNEGKNGSSSSYDVGFGTQFITFTQQLI